MPRARRSGRARVVGHAALGRHCRLRDLRRKRSLRIVALGPRPLRRRQLRRRSQRRRHPRAAPDPGPSWDQARDRVPGRAVRRRLLIAAMIAAAFAATGARRGVGRRHELPVRPSDSPSTVAVGGSRLGNGDLVHPDSRSSRGALAVQFHGDQATGCAARGLCGFSGTVIWQPPPTGTLEADTFRDHGQDRIRRLAASSPAELRAVGPAIDGRRHDRRRPLCAQRVGRLSRRSAPMPRPPVPTSRCRCICGLPHSPWRPPTPSLLGTRCAGPLQSDIASLLARRVVDVATAVRTVGRGLSCLIVGLRRAWSGRDGDVDGAAEPGPPADTNAYRQAAPRPSQPNFRIGRDRATALSSTGASSSHITRRSVLLRSAGLVRRQRHVCPERAQHAWDAADCSPFTRARRPLRDELCGTGAA